MTLQNHSLVTAFASMAIAFSAWAHPAFAQSQDTRFETTMEAGVAHDIAFFERARIGSIELTPFGIVRDQRCADPRFCHRPEDMRVSVVMHDREYPYEVVLALGKPIEVSGGFLILHDPGTRPRQRGALRLNDYALDIEFIPVPLRQQRPGRSPLPRP